MSLAYAEIRDEAARAALLDAMRMRWHPCEACNTTGARRKTKGLYGGATFTACGTCNGAGYIEPQEPTSKRRRK